MALRPKAAACLLVTFMTSGCMSSMLRDKIHDRQSAVHEFTSVTETRGKYIGTRHIGALDYHKYVFPDALVDHKERDLVILIPLDEFRRGLGATNPVAKVEESPPKHISGQQAVLYFDPSSLSSPYPGQDQALRWPKGTSPNLDKDLGVVVLWMAHAGKDTIIIAQAAPGVDKSNSSFNSYFVKPELEYVGRRKTPMCLMYLGYVITIPTDIVTIPFQAVVWYGFKYGT